MNLDEMIASLEFQLSIPHSQPNTVPRLIHACQLLKLAKACWQRPGGQARAEHLEAEARAVLVDLDKPLPFGYDKAFTDSGETNG